MNANTENTNTENTNTEKTVKSKKPADKMIKLAKMQEHIENINKKIDALVAAKKETQVKAKDLHKEIFGNGGGRGRGSKNFGKIKPAIEAHLSKVEQALTVRAISEALNMSYASVYQSLKNAPETFACVNKHWVLVKKETAETTAAQEVTQEAKVEVAA